MSKKHKPLEEHPSFPVTLQSAIDSTTNWRQWMSDNSVPEEIRVNAFFIPVGDILALAQRDDIIGVRAYLGLPGEEADISTLKILLVPVGPSPTPIDPDKGEDIIEEITGTDLVTIYDFTSPCPNFCAVHSPLM